MTELWPIKTALLSVTDKSGLKELAEFLHQQGVQLISTGGTGKMLSTWGIPFQEISAFTGHPEAFQGRMKTISFACASGLLFRREDPADTLEAAQLGIQAIDLVVCNLYPFEETAAKAPSDAELIEQVDIGGPLMVRAAAKNFRAVSVLTDPSQYQPFSAELSQNKGSTSLTYRQRLAVEAFERIAAYDIAIADELRTRFSPEERPVRFAIFTHGKALRYGENPHQKASVYRWSNAGEHSLARADVLQGKELSYNNMLDADAAWKVVSDVHNALGAVSCAVIKHGNPCGLANAPDSMTALNRAWEGDSVSAFGGIVALTAPMGAEEARFFQDRFVEIILAPSFGPDALAILSQKKNLRLMRLPVRPASPGERTLRSFMGGVLWQEEDECLNENFQSVTTIAFPKQLNELARFGVLSAKHLKSNAIALVREKDGVKELVGAGMGQPNRLDSLMKLALPRLEAKGIAASEVLLISDAFFPFADTLELAAKAGIRAIVQPGGSIRDEDVIAAANQQGVAMAFTHERHFRH